MKSLLRKMQSLLRAEDGPTATEYAVLLALIVFGAMAAISLHGCNVRFMYGNIQRGLPSGS